MAFPESINAVINDRLYLARVAQGATLPIPYTFDSDVAATAGAGSITLSLTTVDGVAATSEVIELEHDQPIMFPSNNSVSVDGAGTVGSHTISVDDGAGAIPTDLVAINDFVSFAGDAQLYLVTERTATATEYVLRLSPALQAAPADDAAVTVYNRVRLNLAIGTQFTNVSATGAAVAVTGVKYDMDATNTSQNTYQYRQLLGIETLGPSPEVESVDVANMKFSATLRGSTSFNLEASGQKVKGDAGRREIVIPYLLDSARSAEGVYTEYESNDGDIYRAPGSISESGGESAVDEVETYSYTFALTTGDNFEFWVR